MISVLFFFISSQTVYSLSKDVDLSSCKVTHLGTEYIGKLSKTETNISCKYWHSVTQKGSENLYDEAFPEGSKSLAKNYCRNPNRYPLGPWCYTTHKKLIYDVCNVPLCKIPECRITGPGMEYMGDLQRSASGKPCTKWKDRHRLKPKTRELPFKKWFFPEGSLDKAGKKCRNPDGNIAGPWCYVERDDADLHEIELCDVPFCDDVGTVMYSEGSTSGQYLLFSSINASSSFNISFRLWDPTDWLSGQVFLLLSAYDIAAERNEIERWNSGIEIMISHSGSGILFKNEDTLSNTPSILSGAKWTDLEISWIYADNFSLIIQVFEKPKQKSFAISEILIENTVFETETFRFLSLAGTPALWWIPSDDEDCSVHTITQMNFTRFWLIKKTTLGMDIEIFVRAKREAVLVLRSAPMVQENEVQISIGDKDKVRIITLTGMNQTRQLAEAVWQNILDFWKWEYFKLTLLKDKLQLFWVRSTRTEIVIEASHQNIEKVMWVSFASPWVSYWTIYCDPRGVADPPPATPPECVSQESEPFNGTLSVTEKGFQCIPWSDGIALPDKYQNDDLFKPYGGKANCQNFCRNLDSDPKGAYCIVRDSNNDLGFGIEHCHPRSCSLGDCKIAGTGNDYIGKLNKTRSKRECKPWVEIDNDLVSVENFPDPTLKDASNFCRNPSKNVGGSWCFTKDPKVVTDFCYIKDCDKPLECTVLVSGYSEGTAIYILPRWRKYGLNFWLKSWNPDIYEGLRVSLTSIDGSRSYRLLIGDEDNEKVKLFYSDQNKDVFLLQKTLPHLVPTGKWAGYWLKPGRGKVELGYHGVPNPFFEWVSSKEETSFEPMFINMGTIKGHWIGINFECTECLAVQVSTMKEDKIYPINLWKNDVATSSLRLNLRGSGSAYITLMWTPEFNKHLGVQIVSSVDIIFIIEYINGNQPKVLAVYSVNGALSQNEWSEYVISFTEEAITIFKDRVFLLEWLSPFPLLFYWFGITAEEGTITWTANCPPADIDGEPRDGNWGKWSPWSCSVTCGKGEGRIERVCNDPPPNVFGKECKGSPVYEGPCNDFPCGEISPKTNNLIREYLSSYHKSLEVDAMEKVVLPCNPQAVSLISTEASEINITWTHNGFPYSKIKFHMSDNYSLVIPRAQEKHNGVYFCIAYQNSHSTPSKIVLEVISLVVIKQKPTKKIRKGKSLTLKCNGIALSYVYTDLSQRWEFNGGIWKDYGLGTLQTFTVDKLENISDSHAGVWTCVVIQEDLNFKWKTNWVYLKVKSAPSFWSHLMEDVATAPLFGKLGNERNAMIVFFVLVGFIVGVIVVVTAFLIKWLRK